MQRAAPPDAIVVCAAGGLPGELHKLWQARQVGSYHLEYGYSCMGYEIAGGLGVKLARPEREVIVLVGDGSYLMLNSEIATSVMLGVKLTIVRAGQRRLWLHRPTAARHRRRGVQQPAGRLRHPAAGGFPPRMPRAWARWRNRLMASPNSEAALRRALAADRTSVVVVRTDPRIATAAVAIGGMSVCPKCRRDRR